MRVADLPLTRHATYQLYDEPYCRNYRNF